MVFVSSLQLRRRIHQNVTRFFTQHAKRSDEELLDDAIAVRASFVTCS
jgi:hypothetical protein